MAAPHAVGVAALLKQARPDLTPAEIEHRLQRTGTWALDDYDPNNVRSIKRIDARVALLGDDSEDYDGDGCRNGRELESDWGTGGMRNPLNPWDYYDVLGPGGSLQRDGVIDLSNDILGVVLHYSPSGYADPVLERFDREPDPGIGYGHWDRNGPDGVIDLANDILGVLLQYNADGC
jgi:hypothetical protein